MKRKFKGGLTSVSLPVFIADTSSTTGGGLSGVTSASGGLVLEYRRAGQSSWTSVTPQAGKTLGSYLSGGIVADGSLDGAYEVDFPDAAFASGARMVLCRIRGVTNMLSSLIEIELDAVDYQDAAAFGLSKFANIETDTQDIQNRLPAALVDGRIVANAQVVGDKTGYTATVSDKTGFSLVATTGLGNQTANITGDLTGSVGSISGVSFPANFSLLGIGASGAILLVETVEELGVGALTANGAGDSIPGYVWNALLASHTTANTFGARVVRSLNSNNTVQITGSNHVASVLHDAEPNSIPEDAFATGALSARALNADAANEIATAVSGIQVLSRLDSMIEDNGSGQFRFDTIALEMAPAGGGGGGTDWTADERTAIRAILGVPASGTTPTDPTTGILDTIRDSVGAIGINVYPVSASTPERVAGTMITYYRNEIRTVSVVTDFTLTSLTLSFAVEDSEGTDLLTIANGSISRSDKTFTVSIGTPLTATISNYRWALRDITGGTNSVIARGVLTVQEAASV